MEFLSPSPDVDEFGAGAVPPLADTCVAQLLGTWAHSKGGAVTIEFAEDESSLRIVNPHTGTLTRRVSDFLIGPGKLRYYKLEGELHQGQIVWENNSKWTKMSNGSERGAKQVNTQLDIHAAMKKVLQAAASKESVAPVHSVPHAPCVTTGTSSDERPSFAAQLRGKMDTTQRQRAVEQGKRKAERSWRSPSPKKRLLAPSRPASEPDDGPAQFGSPSSAANSSQRGDLESWSEATQPASPADLLAVESNHGADLAGGVIPDFTACDDVYDRDDDNGSKCVLTSSYSQEDVDCNVFRSSQRLVECKMAEKLANEQRVGEVYRDTYNLIVDCNLAHAEAHFKQLQEAVAQLASALGEAHKALQIMERAIRQIESDYVQADAKKDHNSKFQALQMSVADYLLRQPIVQKDFNSFCEYVNEQQAAHAQQHPSMEELSGGEGRGARRLSDPFAASLLVRGMITAHESDRLGDFEGVEEEFIERTRRAVDIKLHCPLVPVKNTNLDDALSTASSKPNRTRPLCRKHKLSCSILKSKRGQLFFCCPFSQDTGGCGFQRWLGKKPARSAEDAEDVN